MAPGTFNNIFSAELERMSKEVIMAYSNAESQYLFKSPKGNPDEPYAEEQISKQLLHQIY